MPTKIQITSRFLTNVLVHLFTAQAL
jgi:hypothetical protein